MSLREKAAKTSSRSGKKGGKSSNVGSDTEHKGTSNVSAGPSIKSSLDALHRAAQPSKPATSPTKPEPPTKPRGDGTVSLLQTAVKAAGKFLGGKKTSGKGGGGLFPSIPGDIGDIVNFVGDVLPALGGGGGGGMGGIPPAFMGSAPPAFTAGVPRVAGPGGVGKPPMIAAGGAVCPSGYHLAKDGSGRCVRNRRMNVCNMRAARRAVRRIKGAQKELRKIERMLPRRPAARRAPAGHRSRLTHT